MLAKCKGNFGDGQQRTKNESSKTSIAYSVMRSGYEWPIKASVPTLDEKQQA